MKFFEFNGDYYAMIGADTKEEAIQAYEEYVWDIGKETPYEITTEQAKNKYNNAVGDPDEDYCFETEIRENPCILLIDSSLM